MVLFSGTPCQIEGLNKYLDKPYNNLFTVDLICRGVNSPLIYSDWLNSISKTIDKKSINFRDKTFGWQHFCISFKMKRGLYTGKKASCFSRLFGMHLILRPACYNCRFTSKTRVADITLGDFWGIDSFFPDMNDDLGVSCVLCNTEKGKNFFNKISNLCIYKTCEIDDYIPFQPALYKQVEKPFNRDVFWFDYTKYGFRHVIRKYVGMNIINRGMRFLRRMVNH